MGLLTAIWLTMQIVLGRYKEKILLPSRTIFSIAIVSLTTITGTVSFAFAVNYGFFALATGLSALSTAVAAIISWFIFKERLNAIQILLISIAITLVFLIRLFV